MRALSSPIYVLLLAALAPIACGGPHDPVSVSFALAETDCQEELESCGLEQNTQGIVAEAFEPEAGELSEESGDRVLYVDFPAPAGGLAILEISQPPDGLARIRYREVFRGEVSFRGEVISQDVALVFGENDEPMLHGRFEFTAVDSERGTTRRIHSGLVVPVVASTIPPLGPTVPVPRPTEVPPPVPSDPNPRPSPDEEPPSRGPDVSVVVVESAHGCSDPTPEPSGCDDPSSSGGGGCDSGSSSSGCEADSFDSSGCDGASSSGCEADSFDGGGCDNCTASAPAPKVTILHALWRLLWPVLLVGLINRWMRHREPPTQA